MALEIRGTRIYMACGETCPVKFLITEGEIAEEDRGVFTIAGRNGKPLLRKIIAPNEDEKSFAMMFVFEDTAGLRAGGYDWSFRVMRGAKVSAEGKIEQADMQDTPVIRGELRLLEPAGGAM